MALILEIRADSKKAEREIRRFAEKSGASVKRLEGQAVTSSKGMTTAFSGVGKALGMLGIAGSATMAGRALLRMATDFETAMAEVSTLVDTNAVNMGELNDAILDLTTRVPQTAVQLSKGLYQTISAGITDTSEALSVLEVSSKAAVGGLSDTFTAVDAITTILNAYGKSTRETQTVADVFFNTIKEGKTTFTLLANSIGRAAPFAAQAGISFEELTAAVATLTKGGLSTDEAMTAIRATLVGVLKPSEDAKKLASELGLQFDSQALKAKGLSKFLRDVSEATGGNVDQITTLFPNVRALTAVFSLAGEQADEFTRILKSNAQAVGAATEAYQRMNQTATNQWQLFKNQLSKTWLEISEKVLPPFTEVLKNFNAVLRAQGGAIDITNPMLINLRGWYIRTGEAARKATEATNDLAEATEDFGSSAAEIEGDVAEMTVGFGGLAVAARFAYRAMSKAMKVERDEAKETKQSFDEMVLAVVRQNQAILMRQKIQEKAEGMVEARGFLLDKEAARQNLINSLNEDLNTILTTRLETVKELDVEAVKAGFAAEETGEAMHEGSRAAEMFASAAGAAAGNLAAGVSSAKELVGALLSAAAAAAAVKIGGPAGAFIGAFFPSLFAGLFQHGGFIQAGKFGIVGEAGPEIVGGPATVAPVNRFDNRRFDNRQIVNLNVTLRGFSRFDKRTIREIGTELSNQVQRGLVLRAS